MAELTVPRLDFSTLGDLPKTYRDARKEALALRYEEEAPKLLAQLYAAQTAPTQNAQPSLATIGMPQRTASAAPNRVYGNDEPSPLDPPSGRDRDLAIRTILAEAGNQGPTGMQAVGNVIRNRAVDGAYGGDTPSGVVTAPNQFEPWNTTSGRAKMASYDPNSPQYQQAGASLERAYAGDDPTGGARNFFAPKAQAALGRPVPAWGAQGGQDIGDHRFFGGVNDPAALPRNATPTQGAAPQADEQGYTVIPTPATPGMPPQLRAQLPALLKNPQTRASAIALAQKYQNPEQWQLVKDNSGNVFSRNVQNGEMKMLDKSTFLSPQELDQKLQIAKAGATAIYTGDNSKKFDEELDKKSADRWSKIMDNADAADKKLVDITSMREISKRIGSQGASADFKEAIGPYAEALGVSVDGLSDLQAYSSIIQRLAPQQRAPGSGSTSDVEFKGFLKSLPGASQNPLAREMTLNTMEALARDEVARGEIASRLSTKEINRTQAEKELRNLPDPMQGFVAWRKANPEIYGQALKGGAVTADAGQTAPQKTQAIPQGAPQGTKQAPDGKFYVPDPARPGKYLEVR